MRYMKPQYYDTFTCVAAQCPDTCCAGWQIMIDEESLERYSAVDGAFGKRLRNSIDWQEGAFYQNHSRCAFLNEQNLCDLYTALGEDALCETCRKYPRHVEEYEGVREWSLSLSCPIATEIILSGKGMVQFVLEEDDLEDELEEEFEEFDLMLFTQLEDARNVVFEELKQFAGELHRGEKSGINERNQCEHGFDHVMSKALGLAEKMQICMEAGEYFALEDVIRLYQEAEFDEEEDFYEDRMNVEKAAPMGGYDYADIKALYQIIYDLERLREEWNQVLEDTWAVLYHDGEEAYHSICLEFYRYLSRDEVQLYMWENSGLQLFVFFVYTYFCGAVYDDWIYSKMALAVYSVRFIRELLMARWKLRGELTFADCVELAYRYAREIEHSDLNLNALEEYFMEKFMK